MTEASLGLDYLLSKLLPKDEVKDEAVVLALTVILSHWQEVDRTDAVVRYIGWTNIARCLHPESPTTLREAITELLLRVVDEKRNAIKAALGDAVWSWKDVKMMSVFDMWSIVPNSELAAVAASSDYSQQEKDAVASVMARRVWSESEIRSIFESIHGSTSSQKFWLLKQVTSWLSRSAASTLSQETLEVPSKIVHELVRHKLSPETFGDLSGFVLAVAKASGSESGRLAFLTTPKTCELFAKRVLVEIGLQSKFSVHWELAELILEEMLAGALPCPAVSLISRLRETSESLMDKLEQVAEGFMLEQKAIPLDDYVFLATVRFVCFVLTEEDTLSLAPAVVNMLLELAKAEENIAAIIASGLRAVCDRDDRNAGAVRDEILASRDGFGLCLRFPGLLQVLADDDDQRTMRKWWPEVADVITRSETPPETAFGLISSFVPISPPTFIFDALKALALRIALPGTEWEATLMDIPDQDTIPLTLGGEQKCAILELASSSGAHSMSDRMKILEDLVHAGTEFTQS